MLAMPELLKSVKYVVDVKGRPSAAVVDIDEWKRLLEWLDDEEDLIEAHEALAELEAVSNDAEKAGWLKWEDIRGELDE
jgi:PHD/YefM family antitoxin component YafN of YafNO toxin-antitoxin module